MVQFQSQKSQKKMKLTKIKTKNRHVTYVILGVLSWGFFLSILFLPIKGGTGHLVGLTPFFFSLALILIVHMIIGLIVYCELLIYLIHSKKKFHKEWEPIPKSIFVPLIYYALINIISMPYIFQAFNLVYRILCKAVIVVP